MKTLILAAVSLVLLLSACALPQGQGYNRHVCLPDSAVCWLENPR